MRATAAGLGPSRGTAESGWAESSICTLGAGSAGQDVRMLGEVLHCLTTQGAHCRNAAWKHAGRCDKHV